MTTPTSILSHRRRLFGASRQNPPWYFLRIEIRHAARQGVELFSLLPGMKSVKGGPRKSQDLTGPLEARTVAEHACSEGMAQRVGLVEPDAETDAHQGRLAAPIGAGGRARG